MFPSQTQVVNSVNTVTKSLKIINAVPTTICLFLKIIQSNHPLKPHQPLGKDYYKQSEGKGKGKTSLGDLLLK